MFSKIKQLLKNIDAITLGSIFAIVALIGDHFWWARDFILGVWTWHLGIILLCFVSSIIVTIISTIWYYKSSKQEKLKHENQIMTLKLRTDRQKKVLLGLIEAGREQNEAILTLHQRISALISNHDKQLNLHQEEIEDLHAITNAIAHDLLQINTNFNDDFPTDED